MDNKEIYKKTIGFSIRSFLWDLLAIAIFVGLSAIGFVIAKNAANVGLLGLGLGAIAGAIFVSIILRYVAYSLKAAQIAMMTQAISEGKLPDDVIGAGKKVVKERFATVAAYYAVTGVIKGVFRQIGNAITAVGKAVGGDNGSTVGSAISSVIQTIVSYLCDCCLGWVFYRKDEKTAKATCEGAVLFFKHGKTFLKNMGRVFGMGLPSLLVIGGAFTGIFYLIFMNFPDTFSTFSAEFAESAARSGNGLLEFLGDPVAMTWFCAGISGLMIWGIIHSVFIRPFVLVGVLRNYIESGMKDIPSESDFDELDKKSDKFKKLHKELTAEA